MRVSPLGLGTVKLGRNRGVKYPAGFELPDDRQAAGLLELARSLGINLLDTAPAYGASEERLGTLLRGQRDMWRICTKAGEEFDPTSGRSRFDFSATHTRASVERSLRRLGTDRLDIVLVHSNGSDLQIIHETGILEELRKMKEEGKLCAFGLSTKTVEGGLAALECCDCAMVTYNLDDTSQRPVLDRAGELGKGVLVKKPLSSGHVAARGASEAVKASFSFILSHPAVSSAIAGTIDPAHLAMNAEACRGL